MEPTGAVLPGGEFQAAPYGPESDTEGGEAVRCATAGLGCIGGGCHMRPPLTLQLCIRHLLPTPLSALPLCCRVVIWRNRLRSYARCTWQWLGFARGCFRGC